MEERKLNFNAPLLSVRRFSATATTASNVVKTKKIENAQLNRRHTFPSQTSDSNLDQVTEPVAVPFHWEQIPGRRKDGRTPEPQVFKEALVSPRKVSDVAKRQEGKEVVNQKVFRPQMKANPVIESVELDNTKERMAEKAGLDSENEDDVYSDALDTLSPSDSFSMNCSVTGLSNTDIVAPRRSGTFSADPQTRDFMMSRFLPAAKAMTLEPTHYASRKPPVAVEQPKQIVKVVSRDRTPPANRYESALVPYSVQNTEEEESEDEYDGYSNPGNIRSKACGLIPRICFKNSLSILNPVPSSKHRNHPSVPSKRDVEKLSKAAYNKSLSQIVKKVAAFQNSKDAVNKQKPEIGVQSNSPRLMEVKSKLTCGSNRFASDRQGMSRTSSPFRRSGGVSPYRNERQQSPFRRSGFIGGPKEAENMNSNRFNLNSKLGSRSQELVSYHDLKRGSSPLSRTVEKTRSQELVSFYGGKRGTYPVSLAIEKTLYVDTVNRAKTPCSDSSTLDIKGFFDNTGKEFKSSFKSREMEAITVGDSLSQDVKCLDVQRDGKPEPKVLGSDNADSPSLSVDSSLSCQGDTMENSCQESKALVCVNASTNGILDTDSETIVGQTPLPLVLPRTPSESWLWRTLPSISTQNPLSRLHHGGGFQSKLQDPEANSAITKWETIVKSSYLHHDHVRYSEELIPHAAHQSKS